MNFRGLKNTGFTLIEMLVVISIIGVLSTVILSSVNETRKSGVAISAVQDMKNIQMALTMYANDTGLNPPTCGPINCDILTDPYLNSLGVSGWDGPYIELWSMKHPWGGRYSVATVEISPTGQRVATIALDDDAPNTSYSDNSGPVPIDVLLKIDSIMDDGNLSTGKFFGHQLDSYRYPSLGAISAPNEGILIVEY